MWVRSLGQEDLEEEMATHSSILAQEILWTEEPGGLQSMGSERDTQLLNATTTMPKETESASLTQFLGHLCHKMFDIVKESLQ